MSLPAERTSTSAQKRKFISPKIKIPTPEWRKVSEKSTSTKKQEERKKRYVNARDGTESAAGSGREIAVVVSDIIN